MTSQMYLPSERQLALVATLSFIPVAATFFIAPGVWWADYPGIIFHLALFLLVARLPAPEWARAAGYGWLLIDTTVGAMTMNGVEETIFTPMRLGGHIFAGIWIVTASLSGSVPVKVTGIITGLWLLGYTFVSPYFPIEVIAPASIMMIIWLCIISWQDGVAPRQSVTSHQ